MLFNNLFGGNFEGSLVKNFSKKVVRGNSVQTGPNFPAKSLLAGNYATFERILLTGKLMHEY